MRPYIVFILVLFSVLAGCTVQKNQYSISDDQLVNAMADLHVLEFVLKRKDAIPADSIKAVFYRDMETVYGKPISEILENIEHLRNDPVKYNILYNDVARIMEEEMINARKESVQTEFQNVE